MVKAGEIPEGYQDTEVGVIPNDWNISKMGEIGIFFKGKGIRKDQVSDEGFPCIRYGEIYTTHNEYIKSFASYIKNSVAKESIQIKNGDILFAGSGETKEEIGKCVAFITDEGAYAGGDIVILRPSIDCSSLYLGFLLNNRIISSQKSRFGQGDAIVHISANHLSEIFVPLPPKPEQTAIVTALSNTDSLIESIEKLIAKKRNIKKGAMQELLKPKTSWIKCKIEDVADVVGGGTPSTFNFKYWNGEINWFTPTEIGDLKYTYHSNRKITKEGLQNSSARLLPAGTILLTSRASIGDISILMAEGCTNQGFQSLIAKRGFYNEYLYYLVLTLKPLLIQNASGSTFLEISPRKVKAIEIYIPDYNMQCQIAKILSDMDAEIQILGQKLHKYRMIKQGVMQVLLTGKIRLQ